MICPHCQREIADYSSYCYFCGTRQPAPASAAAVPIGPRKRLMRSATESKIAGVCGGIAEYLDADPTVVRLIWALCTFFTGIVLGVLAYIAAWIIMPIAPVYAQAPVATQNSTQQSPRPA